MATRHKATNETVITPKPLRVASRKGVGHPGRDTIRGARYISQIATSPPRPYSAAGSQPRLEENGMLMRRAIAADFQPKSRLARSQTGTSSTASPALTNSESTVCCFRRRIFCWLRSRTTALVRRWIGDLCLQLPDLLIPHRIFFSIADGGSTGRTHAAEKSPL